MATVRRGGAGGAGGSGGGRGSWVEEAETIGRRLRTLRGARSQIDVAVEAGISRVYLSELERGKRPRPRRALLERLAEALGATLEEIGVPPVVDTPIPSGTVLSQPEPEAGGEDEPGREGVEAAPVANAVAVPAGTPIMYRVYRAGTVGDPRRPETAPSPLALERVPVGKEAIVGERGFAVMVRGDHLGAWHLKDGDLCWINPDRPARVGHLVGVEVHDQTGRAGMGVYELEEVVQPGPAREGGGPTVEGRRYQLLDRPSRAATPEVVPVRRFTVLGPVVGIQSWRSPDEGRARPLPLEEVERIYGPEAPPSGAPGPRPPRVNLPPLPDPPRQRLSDTQPYENGHERGAA